MNLNRIHTAVLLNPKLRQVVEHLARREDRSISAQMRQIVLRGLEAMGEWPPAEKNLADTSLQKGINHHGKNNK